VTFIGVIFTNSTAGRAERVNYIDLNDIALPPRHLDSEMRSPVQPLEQTEPDQQPPVEQNEAINSGDKGSTTNRIADIMTTPLGLGMANGYFSSLSEGRTLREDIREYYFEILEKINRRWWQKAGTLTEVAQQDGIIEILIERDGRLLDMRTLRSTGSREVDRAVIDEINESAPFPPLPASYESGTFHAPLKISKPSHLLGTKNFQ